MNFIKGKDYVSVAHGKVRLLEIFQDGKLLFEVLSDESLVTLLEDGKLHPGGEVIIKEEGEETEYCTDYLGRKQEVLYYRGKCPICYEEYRFHKNWKGKEAKCPNCENTITITRS